MVGIEWVIDLEEAVDFDRKGRRRFTYLLAIYAVGNFFCLFYVRCLHVVTSVDEEGGEGVEEGTLQSHRKPTEDHEHASVRGDVSHPSIIGQCAVIACSAEHQCANGEQRSSLKMERRT